MLRPYWLMMKSRSRGEDLELDEAARHTTDGSFVALPNGVTHYELGGRESGQAVVLVPGFSVPYFIYDPTFAFLTQAGFRVLRYDLFGRGFSDRPRVRYTIDLFVNQLNALLIALRLTGPVNLVGLSMGGPIAAAFTVRHPDRVRRLALIDPAGARSVANRAATRLAKLPWLPELLLRWVGNETLVKSAARDFFDPRLVAQFLERYRVQMRYKGFRRALLSTIRSGMLASFRPVYRALGRLGTPVLLLWGREDQTVPFAHSRDLREALPQAQFQAIAGAGHIPHYEKPGEVNPLLFDFFSDPKGVA